MNKEDKILCDDCINFYVHPSGVLERCNKRIYGEIGCMTKEYCDERMNGNERKCKGFEKI